jgi:acetamidase/formamidase
MGREKRERRIIREASASFGERQHDIEVIFELPEPVIAALDDDLPASREMIHRDPPIEQFISGGMEEQIAVQLFGPGDMKGRHLLQMPLGKLVGLASVQILLRPKVGTQALVRRNAGVHQDRANTIFFCQPGSIKTAQRASYQRYFLGRALGQGMFQHAHRLARPVWQGGTDEFLRLPECNQPLTQLIGLGGSRRTVEAMDINNHDVATQCDFGHARLTGVLFPPPVGPAQVCGILNSLPIMSSSPLEKSVVMDNDSRRGFLIQSGTLAAAPWLPAAVLAEERPLAGLTVGAKLGDTHVLPATPQTTQWGWFDNAQPPVLRMRSGERVAMETQMAAANQILPGVSIEEITQLRLAFPGRGPHTITGPIYIEEAEPGDTLKIHIERIVPRSYGANWNLPGSMGLGQFPERFPNGQVRYFYFDRKTSSTEFAPGIRVPLRPFPGVLGVARAQAGRYSTVPPGPFGGNMDVREMIEGTTLYLPVFVEGALLWSGDSHAAQGNGEINLTAIETAFNELRLHVEVIKGASLAWPRIETLTHWITVGYDRDLNKALEILKTETRVFLAQTQNLAPEKTDELMATRYDCRIAEVVNQVKGVFCAIPKKGVNSLRSVAPPRENPQYFVTSASSPDLQTAMNEAAFAMIELIAERKGLSPIDAYSLASLTMDSVIGDISEGKKMVYCLVPKNLWTA